MSALAIWQLVRRFWPYAVGALVVIAAVLAVRHYGAQRYEAGARSRDHEVAQLAGSIAAQNAAIEVQRQATVAATAASEAATQRAQEARKATAALSGRLKAAGRVAGPCKVAAVNAEGWKAAQ
mgnify:CR=1 FL=1